MAAEAHMRLACLVVKISPGLGGGCEWRLAATPPHGQCSVARAPGRVLRGITSAACLGSARLCWVPMGAVAWRELARHGLMMVESLVLVMVMVMEMTRNDVGPCRSP